MNRVSLWGGLPVIVDERKPPGHVALVDLKKSLDSISNGADVKTKRQLKLVIHVDLVLPLEIWMSVVPYVLGVELRADAPPGTWYVIPIEENIFFGSGIT